MSGEHKSQIIFLGSPEAGAGLASRSASHLQLLQSIAEICQSTASNRWMEFYCFLSARRPLQQIPAQGICNNNQPARQEQRATIEASDLSGDRRDPNHLTFGEKFVGCRCVCVCAGCELEPTGCVTQLAYLQSIKLAFSR